ncbi:hypothetical protein ACS0TY_029646 [Phlomoides rotata]
MKLTGCDAPHRVLNWSSTKRASFPEIFQLEFSCVENKSIIIGYQILSDSDVPI